ncbi:MAG: hypothetical protein JEZ02_13445 [Desulfatibacillum sp.]|nr:hypothetical protein [Desulfatibacillum sp.]
MTTQGSQTSAKIFSKKCPYCSTILTLADTKCHACHRKVGDPDKHGIAIIPGKWKAYVWFAVAIGILGGWFYFWKTYL